jgi:acetyltransferase-like isoleucine patch superfamily enzyme
MLTAPSRGKSLAMTAAPDPRRPAAGPSRPMAGLVEGPPPREAYAGFGAESVIAAPAIVTCPHRIEIGDGVFVLPGAWLSVVEEHQGRRYEPRLRIGDRVTLGRDIVIACIGLVEIGADVLTGDRVFIGDTYHDFRDPSTPVARQQMVDPRPVRIGRGAFLGLGAIVLPGVRIGENGYVGAGAVVTEDVPDRCVVVGNPARVVRRWDEATGQWTREPGPGRQGGPS